MGPAAVFRSEAGRSQGRLYQPTVCANFKVSMQAVVRYYLGIGHNEGLFLAPRLCISRQIGNHIDEVQRYERMYSEKVGSYLGSAD